MDRHVREIIHLNEPHGPEYRVDVVSHSIPNFCRKLQQRQERLITYLNHDSIVVLEPQLDHHYQFELSQFQTY